MKIVTHNGSALNKSEREARQALWLGYCSEIEADLGPCTSETVASYRERLEAFDSNYPKLSARGEVDYPATPDAMQALLGRTGAHALAFQEHEGEIVVVAHVAT